MAMAAASAASSSGARDWMWTLSLVVRPPLRNHGYADTRDKAQAAFRAAWEQAKSRSRSRGAQGEITVPVGLTGGTIAMVMQRFRGVNFAPSLFHPLILLDN